MAKTNYIERVNGFIVPYLAKNGYELIKTEFVNEDNNYYLRLYIDLTEEEQAKREAKAASEEPLTPGVSINDCVKVSRYLSKWLDKEDFIKEMYTMEVCSRGFLNDAGASDDKEKEQ